MRQNEPSGGETVVALTSVTETAPAWTPARVYAVGAGVYLVVAGAIGFALDASFPTAASEVAANRAYIFGLLETNGWHNLAALLLGAPLLLVAAIRPRQSAPFALLAGTVNAIVFVAFELWDPATFWVASNGADQVVHALLALGGIGAAIAGRRSVIRA